MALTHSKIVPAAFWVGFLALGFATSFGGPPRHRVEHVAGAGRTLVATETAAPATAARADARIAPAQAARNDLRFAPASRPPKAAPL